MTLTMKTFERSTWRMIRHAPASGAWNMAADEAILEAAASGAALPTLRLYAWDPPCLSLGYAQPLQDVDLEALARYGWDLVRRPTGGRAILHTDELTYSVTGPADEPRLAGGVLESYQALSQALLQTLHFIGIPAEAHEKSAATNGAANPVCFEVPSNYEITVQGKKLIGSAQARRNEGVLQHGTLPLTGDLTRIVSALVCPDETTRRTAAERVLKRAATCEAILGRSPAWEEAAAAMAAAFKQALNLELIEGEMTPAEIQRAQALYVEKYTQLEWAQRH
jgi:lipoate-protein ligase A